MQTITMDNNPLAFFHFHFKGLNKVGSKLKPATVKKASQTCMCMHQVINSDAESNSGDSAYEK